jgi:hypothetical protein
MSLLTNKRGAFIPCPDYVVACAAESLTVGLTLLNLPG